MAAIEYLTVFDTHSEYEDYIGSITRKLPNVSLCENGEVHFKPVYDSKLNLLYHWEASDGLVGSNWVDRISGRKLVKSGTTTVTTIDGVSYFALSYNNYFYLSLNHATSGLSFGDEWRVELELNETRLSGNSNWFVDFGSLTNATHAFGISHSNNEYLAFNSKFNGNSSNSYYAPVSIKDQIYGELKKITFGSERFDDTRNITYCRLNDSAKSYGNNIYPKEDAYFNKNFNSTGMRVGRGCIQDTGYQVTGTKYIKSLKIFGNYK